MKRIKFIFLIICVFVLISCEYSQNNRADTDITQSKEKEGAEDSSVLFVSDVSDVSDIFDVFETRRLICKHTDLTEFYNSVQNPREFVLSGGHIYGGIVPHHLAAATLISGFFKAAADLGEKYDTVVIVAPNHVGATGDIITSFKDWQVWDNVFCDTDIVEKIYKKRPDGYEITENDDRMEEEHAVSVLIPYIKYYLPDAKVAPFLLNRRLTLETVYNFAKILSDEINASGKKVLFIGSIDFSHYLPISFAKENDKITEAAILNKNYRKIQEFSNEYVDSPQSLNTFLLYLENMGVNNIEILYNSDMSEFYGEGINETTSYFIISAYDIIK